MVSPTSRRFQKSLGVGAIASLTDLLLLAVLVDGAGVSPTVANVPALFAGALIQFLGNKLYAFDDQRPAWVRQGGAFAAVELGSLALNAAAFQVLVGAVHLPYAAARVLGSALVYLGFSYPLWRRVFTPPFSAERSPAPPDAPGDKRQPR
ncbi:MAG: GtrA family protein [Myxococcota bacterium]